MPLLSILLLQFSRNLRDNLLPILCALIAKYFSIDALAYMPVHHGLSIVGCSCHMTTRLLDNLTQILHQGLCIILLYLLNVHISQFFLIPTSANLKVQHSGPQRCVPARTADVLSRQSRPSTHLRCLADTKHDANIQIKTENSHHLLLFIEKSSKWARQIQNSVRETCTIYSIPLISSFLQTQCLILI